MLVLARQPNESVVVGGDDGLNRLLKVTVQEIRKGLVSSASKRMNLYRSIPLKYWTASRHRTGPMNLFAPTMHRTWGIMFRFSLPRADNEITIARRYSEAITIRQVFSVMFTKKQT